MEVDEDRIEGEKSGTAVLGRHSNCNPFRMVAQTSIGPSIGLPVLLQNFYPTHENQNSGWREVGEVN